ncbi:hypothetical protein FA95DRAFT_1561924 [Auriscalpium vulgare]|uniref:Uncharacterized protein n=1 Tax=Auriscalpium vulgare TaxID=40419 RepID=A0ACB8RKT7_9AGAM|nr:hypothetical protein FA95DRAFT_1561924 [Auriscalpium vulgare]
MVASGTIRARITVQLIYTLWMPKGGQDSVTHWRAVFWRVSLIWATGEREQMLPGLPMRSSAVPGGVVRSTPVRDTPC